jgi:hypothetical protein
VTAALLITGGYQALGLFAILISARAGVVTVTVRRPPQPRKTPEATP